MRRSVAAVTLITMLASCTGYVPVPPSDYASVSGSRTRPCRIETSDGRVITADRFTVADSTIVVERIIEEGKRVDVPEPLRIPLKDVVSIECAELEDRRNSYLAVVVFAVAVISIGLYSFLANLPSD